MTILAEPTADRAASETLILQTDLLGPRVSGGFANLAASEFSPIGRGKVSIGHSLRHLSEGRF